MPVVNTNVSASISQAALTKNERSLESTMEKLSTGSKINSAADDAAGLAMAAKFTSQIRGLDMAIKNANDAVSMLATAEGALDEVTNMLQRMRELAVQAGNGTVTADVRQYIDLEYQALNAEITRISTNTEWNGEAVLNGKAGDAGENELYEENKFTFQVSGNFTAGTASAAVKYQTADVLPTGVSTLYDDGKATSGSNRALDADSSAASWRTALGLYNTANPGNQKAIPDSLQGTEALKNTDKELATSNDTIIVDFGNLTNDVANITTSDVKTQANAQGALSKLDTGITAISERRATFGSASNRLVHAIDNMTNIMNNAEASRSRIEDTDYAEATSELAKAQIIQQAATAMLAQANQLPQSVLSLLK